MTSRTRLVILIAIAVSFAAILTIYFVARSERRARQTTIHIALDLPDVYQESLVTLLDRDLAKLDLTSPNGAPLEVFSFNLRGPSGDWDVIVGTADTFSPRSSLFALDPFVLLSQTVAGIAPSVNTGSTIGDLSSWLETLDTELWTPFVVAGDEPRDFAAFILYLAGEILSSGEYRAILEYLAQTDVESDDDSLELQIGNLARVIDLLMVWRSLDIVPYNWTDWDSIAIESEILKGSAAITFASRSVIKTLDWQARLDLEVHRLPSGASRREYQMIGEGVKVSRGDGVLRDQYDEVALFLTGGSFQERIESDTIWTPLRSTRSPVNREHRDVVRWIEGSREITAISPEIYNHALFERLHILLR